MGIETILLIGTATSTGIGAWSALKKGQMEEREAIMKASDMEVELEARNVENSVRRLNEENQRLQLARDFDAMRRQQNVAFASSGFMGNSFNRIQAADLSKYTEEQMNREFLSGIRESVFKTSQKLFRNEIAATRRSGGYAARSGGLQALGGSIKAGTEFWGAYESYQGGIQKKKTGDKKI